MKISGQAAPERAQEKPTVQEVRALLVDIFKLTGQKVEIDDPVVTAALVYSMLVRRAGQDAARAIDEAAQRARDAQALDGGIKNFWGYAKSLTHWQIWFHVIICFFSSTYGAVVALALAYASRR